MPAESHASHLRCIDCGATAALGYRLQCERCAGLLELVYDEAALAKAGPGVFDGSPRGSGLWRYAAVLPVADPAHRVSLGEGASPLLDCPTLARRLGVRRLLLKFEGSNPTGTVKDRSSATAVGAALQFGFRATSVVSSGNAGSSIAAYSARAGLRSIVFAYERASAPKLLHMAATTGDLVIYRGVYDDLISLWDRLAEDRLFFDCGASRNAYKQEGKKTLAYEIAEQTGWTPPDVVVAPVAVGETFIACHRGFAEMARLGWIPRAPRLVAAQATRANAVARAWRDGGEIVPQAIGYTVAEGLAAGKPGRKGDWVLRILRQTEGVAGDAEDDEILAAQGLLARTEGVWAGPTGVATLAVLIRLLAARALDPDACICVVISETGLKTDREPPARDGTAFDEATLRRLVRERLADAGKSFISPAQALHVAETLDRSRSAGARQGQQAMPSGSGPGTGAAGTGVAKTRDASTAAGSKEGPDDG